MNDDKTELLASIIDAITSAGGFMGQSIYNEEGSFRMILYALALIAAEAQISAGRLKRIEELLTKITQQETITH